MSQKIPLKESKTVSARWRPVGKKESLFILLTLLGEHSRRFTSIPYGCAHPKQVPCMHHASTLAFYLALTEAIGFPESYLCTLYFNLYYAQKLLYSLCASDGSRSHGDDHLLAFRDSRHTARPLPAARTERRVGARSRALPRWRDDCRMPQDAVLPAMAQRWFHNLCSLSG